MDAVLITCEHGGNHIPPPYESLFHGAGDVLESHRGHDPGALDLARQLAKALAAPLVASTVSRLLVELNRSPGHPRQFSEFTRGLPKDERDRISARHYAPYREQVEATIHALTRRHRVVHISSHSFTPVMDGDIRTADIGLLYDPRRGRERAFCDEWKAVLLAAAPSLRVRRNYPYAGKSDGLTAYLRKRYPDERYAGIELEINQKFVLDGGREWSDVRGAVVDSLVTMLR